MPNAVNRERDTNKTVVVRLIHYFTVAEVESDNTAVFLCGGQSVAVLTL
jgi:hypothetical protein